MRRELLAPRADWAVQMESIGFHYHSIDGTYWDESRCYVFAESQIDALETATAELHEMALNAAQHVIGSGRYADFAIAADWQGVIEQSWDAYRSGRPEGFTLFGRMDLSYDGKSAPKLLEYNADTPTACLEASVAQWQWLKAMRPNADQFNSLHERLVAAWKVLKSQSRVSRLHFAAVGDSSEDWGNLDYLRDTAIQAGWQTISLPVDRIGWNGTGFVDEFNVPIKCLVKLYPWEWLVREDFGTAIALNTMSVIEPAWKMLLSNKAILVVLWELYPDHPNLLPAYFDSAPVGADFVKKPILSREGCNISLVSAGAAQDTTGEYGAEGFVYQALAPLPKFGDDYAVIGSWIVGDKPAGIGIREDATPITRNTSRFVPHYFE